MKPLSPFPLAIALLLSTATAQESTTVQTLQVRCRGGVDLRLDPETWFNMFPDVDLRPLLTPERAALINRCRLQAGDMPVDATSGHVVELHTTYPRELSSEQLRELEAVAMQCLEQRLNAVFYDPHREQLERDIAMTRAMWQRLGEEMPEPSSTSLPAIAQSLQQRHDRLREQLSEVRITLATEAKARDYVRERMERQEHERQKLEAQYIELARTRDEQQAVVEALRAQLQAATGTERVPDQMTQQRERTRTLESAGMRLDRDLQRLQRDLEQNFRQSTFYYEQLPLLELALLRAEVRQQVLDDERKRLDYEQEELRAKSVKVAEQTLRAERNRVELRTLEQRLGELQGELARLQPVRVQVITRR